MADLDLDAIAELASLGVLTPPDTTHALVAEVRRLRAVHDAAADAWDALNAINGVARTESWLALGAALKDCDQ